MTSCTRSTRGGFWEIRKSQELWTRHRMRRVDFWGLQRPGEFARYGRRTRWRADGKVIIERLCISLPYVETFNSKVIKGFVPELWSRKCFSCFEIPMFYVYMLWTFYVRFPYSCMGMLQCLTPPTGRYQELFAAIFSVVMAEWFSVTHTFFLSSRQGQYNTLAASL